MRSFSDSRSNAMTPTSDRPIFIEPPEELLRDARADYRMCVASGLIDSSSDDWQIFLEGYAAQTAFYAKQAAPAPELAALFVM